MEVLPSQARNAPLSGRKGSLRAQAKPALASGSLSDILTGMRGEQKSASMPRDESGRFARKQYPRPEGPTVRSNQECPLCHAPPGVAHKRRCPWLLWADGATLKAENLNPPGFMP